MTQNFEELTTRQLGAFGEDFVAEMLEDQGWEIIARNERVGRYELDLIAEDVDGRLHFVEVKTRRSSRSSQFGDGREAITAAKLRHLYKAAAQVAVRKLYLLVGVRCYRLRRSHSVQSFVRSSSRSGYVHSRNLRRGDHVGLLDDCRYSSRSQPQRH